MQSSKPPPGHPPVPDGALHEDMSVVVEKQQTSGLGQFAVPPHDKPNPRQVPAATQWSGVPMQHSGVAPFGSHVPVPQVTAASTTTMTGASVLLAASLDPVPESAGPVELSGVVTVPVSGLEPPSSGIVVASEPELLPESTTVASDVEPPASPDDPPLDDPPLDAPSLDEPSPDEEGEPSVAESSEVAESSARASPESSVESSPTASAASSPGEESSLVTPLLPLLPPDEELPDNTLPEEEPPEDEDPEPDGLEVVASLLPHAASHPASARADVVPSASKNREVNRRVMTSSKAAPARTPTNNCAPACLNESSIRVEIDTGERLSPAFSAGAGHAASGARPCGRTQQDTDEKHARGRHDG
jgi:hypothetical protein